MTDERAVVSWRVELCQSQRGRVMLCFGSRFRERCVHGEKVVPPSVMAKLQWVVVRDKRFWEKMARGHGVLYRSRFVRCRLLAEFDRTRHPFLDNDAARSARFVKGDAISG